MLVHILVDGDEPTLTCEASPLADTQVGPRPADEPGLIPRATQVLAIGGTIVTARAFHGHPTGWWLDATVATIIWVWTVVLAYGVKVFRRHLEIRNLQQRVRKLFAQAGPVAPTPLGPGNASRKSPAERR